jgi:hypothetical protein
VEFLIATVIGVVGLSIAYFTYLAQVAPGFKRLHYTSVAFDLVLPVVHNDLRGLFKLYLKGQELINPVVCAARIQNTGKAPIRPEDFDAPLTIEAAEKDVIFRGGTIECDPPNIFKADRDRSNEAPFQVQMNKFTIRPVLLNPDDKFEVVYIADMIPEKWDLTVSCRIAGVKQAVRVPRLADGQQLEMYFERIELPGGVTQPEPGRERLNLYIWSAPILADTDRRFEDFLDLRVGNKTVKNPNLLYVIISNEGRQAITPSGSSVVSVDLPGTRINRLVTRLADSSEDERDGASYVRTINSHKIAVRVPQLNPGETIRASAIVSGNCAKPIVESKDFVADEALLVQVRTGDHIEKNLAKMNPKILLSNQRLYLIWQRKREEYEWRSRHRR